MINATLEFYLIAASMIPLIIASVFLGRYLDKRRKS